MTAAARVGALQERLDVLSEQSPNVAIEVPDDQPALDVFVPGQPAAQGSKRHVGGGRMVESSKAVAPWRTAVAWHAAQAYTGALLDGPVAVDIEFVMKRPTATPKRRTPPAIRKPDLDKTTRAIFDALSGVVWSDDARVVELHARKRLAELGEQPGARIVVRVVSEQ